MCEIGAWRRPGAGDRRVDAADHSTVMHAGIVTTTVYDLRVPDFRLVDPVLQ
jgi:hypothetical protein